MLKKILLILIIFFGMSAFAAENYLNSVVLSKIDGQTSIILRSDEKIKITKDIESLDKIVLSVKGISQAANINTLYKDVPEVNSLIIQNDGNNGLKIFIEAPNISRANIISETPDAAPVTVNDAIAEGKVLFSVLSIVLLLFIMKSARNNSGKEVKKDINDIIKEREKALYKSFQKEVASSMPSINYKLKSYRKHVLKGETIRSYENRTTVKV